MLVNNLKISKSFFIKTLKPLGYKLLVKKETSAGFGTEDIESKRDFWIKYRKIKRDQHSFSCLSFTASSKKMVNDFYDCAIKAGGKDNGAPGYRKKYHKGYYAAFVLDPDGHNIEAVFDDPNLKE